MNRPKKLKNRVYVLDTNVLIHSPESIFTFEEHTVFIPLRVLEELDNHKRGQSDIARNARQAHRYLDDLIRDIGVDELSESIPIGRGKKAGKVRFQTFEVKRMERADDEIIEVAKYVGEKLYGDGKTSTVLVTKDINLRIRALLRGVETEDYTHDQAAVIGDGELTFSGQIAIPDSLWNQADVKISTEHVDGKTVYSLESNQVKKWPLNARVYSDRFDGILRQVQGKVAKIEILTDYRGKHQVWGVSARNDEQNFALAVLCDPEIDFVTLGGDAGTGKTMLALAAGLQQVFEDKLYDEIIVTRAAVPLGHDIGFLPGSEEEKVGPYLGALQDNLESLTRSHDGDGHDAWSKKVTTDLVMSRIKIKSTSLMRGRSFQRKYFLIDEAQNLTSREIVSLISRAGQGTKVVCIGNLKQIDTPYLTASTSGFSYAIERMGNWEHSAHIVLQGVERSRLAMHATEVFR